jgi:murein L,D-transpeptidase YcbB/YkuD
MIDKLKFALFSIIVLALVGVLGYWAVMTIKSGSQFAATQKIGELQQQNEDLIKQVADLTQELNDSQTQVANLTPVPTQIVTPPTTPIKPSTPTSTTSTTYKNQTLINQLQQLITDNINMKLKSTGTRVGTVQNFLNLYNNASNKIDNDYGASTVKAITAFQKAQGLTADGQAGASTFNKMIGWLEKQG